MLHINVAVPIASLKFLVASLYITGGLLLLPLRVILGVSSRYLLGRLLKTAYPEEPTVVI